MSSSFQMCKILKTVSGPLDSDQELDQNMQYLVSGVLSSLDISFSCVTIRPEKLTVVDSIIFQSSTVREKQILSHPQLPGTKLGCDKVTTRPDEMTPWMMTELHFPQKFWCKLQQQPPTRLRSNPLFTPCSTS